MRGDAVKWCPAAGVSQEPGPGLVPGPGLGLGPGPGGSPGPLRWAPRKNPSQSTIGAAAPRDMLALRGPDEDTPWEGRPQWG